jgi:signal transduction histidine kinase
LDDHIPPFAFDPVRIRQVMTNLISNSIKYSNPHTVVTVFSRIDKEGKAEIEVKDHGIGIEEDKMEHLFQPFAQGNFLQKAKGTGLGLYITKAIITEHDGKIWLNSKVGEGTTVYFNLPIDDKKPEKAQTAMVN